MLRRLARGSAWLGVCAPAWACAVPGLDASVGTSTSAIIDGDASTAQQNFVVEIAHPVGSLGVLVCSGALVAPNLVLTARHCVASTSDTAFTCDQQGNGSAGGAISADYDPSTVLIYAGLDSPTAFTAPSAHALRFFHDDATNVCNHDLALIELSAPLTSYPVATLDLDTTLSVGQTLTTVGWGVLADGGSPAVRQQRGAVPVVSVGPTQDSLGYDVAPNDFAVGESICEGDSGGPALAASGAVVGVVSSGGNDSMSASMNPAVTCLGADTVNLYTETAAFRDVILDAFSSVGATPVLVNVALGESCSASSECSSGLCTTIGDAGLLCSESCASMACPDGFRCDVSGGKSLCVSAPSSGCAVAPRDDAPMSLVPLVALLLGLAPRLRRRRA